MPSGYEEDTWPEGNFLFLLLHLPSMMFGMMVRMMVGIVMPAVIYFMAMLPNLCASIYPARVMGMAFHLRTA